MLKNAYLLAKIGADTAENERNFAENLPEVGNYVAHRCQSGRRGVRRRYGGRPEGAPMRAETRRIRGLGLPNQMSRNVPYALCMFSLIFPYISSY